MFILDTSKVGILAVNFKSYFQKSAKFYPQNLNRIDFEGKKDVAQVFNNVLRRQIGTRSPTVEYICTKPEILFTLMSG